MHKVLLKREKSETIFKRSCQVIPGGVNSPVRSFPGLNQTPLVAASAHGDTVVDVDGNSFIDYCGSWGALIHGHAHPQITSAARARLELGSTFGLTTPIEANLADLAVELLPGIEKIRFVSSGTEATMSAIRVARGFTGRSKIIKFAGNYHGHSDAFLVQAGSGLATLGATSSSAGVPKESIQHTLCLPYNDIEACHRAFQNYGEDIAAVILEPIAANMGLVEPSREFIHMLRKETRRFEALLIFDEVITGFRVALGGSAEYFDVTPDLACYGKIIGGGLPAAAFGGRAEIMEVLAPLGAVYQAGTLSGNPVAMEAGYQSVSLCTEPQFYETLREKTNMLTIPIQKYIEKNNIKCCLKQVGSLFTLFCGIKEAYSFEEVKKCDINMYNRLFLKLFQEGIYLAPSQFETNFVSTAHTTEHLSYTRDCILEALSYES